MQVKEFWSDDFSVDQVNQALELRMAAYRKERRDFWIKEMPFMALACLLASSVFWGVLHFAGVEIDYWKFGLVSLALLVLPILITHPKRPTKETVAYSKLLNEIGDALNTKG